MVPVIRDAGRLSFSGFLGAVQRPDRRAPARTSSPPTTCRAPTSRSPTPAGSERSLPFRGS
jgi:hypothetical protein